MGVLGEGLSFARFALGLRGYVRHPISLDEATDILRRRLDEREANFLRTAEQAIFGHPVSPYLPLLRMAGCGLDDLRVMVAQRGLEPTLEALRSAGVYLSAEEAKGRVPVQRAGLELRVTSSDLDNPRVKSQFRATSGGSTGAPTYIGMDIQHLVDQAVLPMLTFSAHGTLGAPMLVWRGMMPDPTGLNHVLRGLRMGQASDRWYTPVAGGELKTDLKYRLATLGTVLAVRLAGKPMPWPTPLHLQEAAVVAEWLADALRQHRKATVHALVSTSMRVAMAAREAGLDLTGTVFVVGGEPLTPAKAREIERSGARTLPFYGFTEAPLMGAGCAAPVEPNDLHFARDRAALIRHPRAVPGSDIVVDAFHFTTLLPTAPKVLLNVQNDDYGVVEERACGCPLERHGLTTHLREVHSFGKLHGEGVTVGGSEMVRVLEEVLPARFGGGALDYQLVEEEDEAGFTRLTLLVHPRIPLADEAAVIETVLQALRASSVAADLAQLLWRQAGSWRVRRAVPVHTARGKLLPLHLGRRNRQGPAMAPPSARPGGE